MFRRTAKRSEGSLKAWRVNLLNELKKLEENLDPLYQFVGLNTLSVLGKNANDEDTNLKPQEEPNDPKVGFEPLIDQHLSRVGLAVGEICKLITMQTEFDLPIPVPVLLKMTAKISSLRWRDYKKKPIGMVRNYVFSLTPNLIQYALMMFRTILSVLSTNIIPFTPFINQTILRLLDWTRTSNLMSNNEVVFHSIRSQLFQFITFMMEQLSLNVNLEPQLLKALLEVELLGNIGELIIRSGPMTCDSAVRDKHLVDALSCLENLLITYAGLLEEQIESKVKNFVLKTGIKIYRDFETASSTTSVDFRRQLMQLLQTIANQPYATSTTEISYHIFELAEKFESDPDLRSLARRSLKVGLAHRPTIVTHHDVYNCYGRPMLTASEEEEEQQQQIQDLQPDEDQEEVMEASEVNSDHDVGNHANGHEPEEMMQIVEVDAVAVEVKDVDRDGERERAASDAPRYSLRSSQSEKVATSSSFSDSKSKRLDLDGSEDATADGGCDKEIAHTGEAAIIKNKAGGDEDEELAGDDSEISSYMNCFVEKLA